MARRGHHEGSIFRRDDAKTGKVRWVAELTLPDGRRRTLYASTRQRAQQRLAEAKREIEQGVVLGSDRQTVSQFLEGWLESVAASVKESTHRRYASSLRLHVMPAGRLGSVRLQSLSGQHIQKLYAQLAGDGASASTIQHTHRALHAALASAVKLGLLARNVTDLADRPREKRRELRVLSPEQARHFLDTARGDRLEALYVLAVSTGMRQSELLGLRWADVELDRATLAVRYQLAWSERERRYVFASPKTKRSRRRIALSLPAVVSLRRHRARQDAERLSLGPAWVDMDLVFCTSIGSPIEGANLRTRSFKPLLARAGLPDMRFHDLRHTAATLLLGQGVNVKVVSEMLGHETTAMTLDTYQHVLPHMQEDAASKMADALGWSQYQADDTDTRAGS